MKRILLAAAALLAASHMARAAAPACIDLRAADTRFVPLPMSRLVEHADEDPSRIWTNWDLWHFNQPQKTTIWQGSVRTCAGEELVVSQVINRACSSASVCPARVVLRTPSEQRVLIGYKQLCTLHQTFELRGDLAEIRACDQAYPLER